MAEQMNPLQSFVISLHQDNKQMVIGKMVNPTTIGTIGAFVWISFDVADEEAAKALVKACEQLRVQVPSRDDPDITETKILSVQYCGPLAAARNLLIEKRKARAEKAKQFKLNHAEVAGRMAAALNNDAQARVADTISRQFLMPESRKRPR